MSIVGYQGRDQMRERAEKEFPGVNGRILSDYYPKTTRWEPKKNIMGTYKKGGRVCHQEGRMMITKPSKKALGGMMGCNFRASNPLVKDLFGKGNARAINPPSWPVCQALGPGLPPTYAHGGRIRGVRRQHKFLGGFLGPLISTFAGPLINTVAGGIGKLFGGGRKRPTPVRAPAQQPQPSYRPPQPRFQPPRPQPPVYDDYDGGSDYGYQPPRYQKPTPQYQRPAPRYQPPMEESSDNSGYDMDDSSYRRGGKILKHEGIRHVIHRKGKIC